MPKSRVRKKPVYTPPPTRSPKRAVSPPWLVPAMLVCLLAGLAWIADSIGFGLSQAVGPLSRATSLDNTIRYAAAAQSEWVLADVHAHAAADGYAYGDVHLFSENGTLLATGSQTCVARAGTLSS